MKKISILVLLVLSVLAASCSLAAGPVTLKDGDTGNTVILYPTDDEGLLFYHNDRFGYEMRVPEIFTKVVLLPENEDGMILESEDGKAAFRTSGGFVMIDGMLGESYDNALESIGGEDKAVYFDIGEDSWELTWWEGETFHRRKFLMDGEEVWGECEISYQSVNNEAVRDPLDEIMRRAIQSLAFGKG